jgi:DNA end-binding protein Ku
LPDKKVPAAAARSFWSGTITFGLISIPVDLFAAARARQKSMRMVDEEGHALGRRYYCPKHDQILTNEELVRGYETDSGKMVVITDEEFESAAPEKSRDIELKRFVPVADIAPSFFDRPYFLAPGERAGKAYTLLAQTMAKTGKAGIGSFVMRSHEYLVAIIAEGGVLRAEVLRYGNEVRTPEVIGLPEPSSKPNASLVRELSSEIDELSEKAIDLGEMEDLEADALRKFAERKAKSGKGVIGIETLEDDDGDSKGGAEVIDLMKLLQKSLGGKTEEDAKAPAAGDARSPTRARKTPSARGVEAASPEQEKKPPARKPAAKASKAKPPDKKSPGKKAPSKKVAPKTSAAKAPAKRAAARKTA